MKTILAFIIVIMSTTVQAQEVKNFTLTNIKDSKEVSLTNFTSAKAVAIVFTSHECPFDNYYKERLKELIQTYSGKVQFLLVNSNTEEQESIEQMAIHYTDVPVPYLADKDQAVMLNIGAKKTPEVFLLIPANGKFVVAYSGAIDDNPQAAKDVRQHFFKEAIEKVLANQKIEMPNQRATGCTIRKK